MVKMKDVKKYYLDQTAAGSLDCVRLKSKMVSCDPLQSHSRHNSVFLPILPIHFCNFLKPIAHQSNPHANVRQHVLSIYLPVPGDTFPCIRRHISLYPGTHLPVSGDTSPCTRVPQEKSKKKLWSVLAVPADKVVPVFQEMMPDC